MLKNRSFSGAKEPFRQFGLFAECGYAFTRPLEVLARVSRLLRCLTQNIPLPDLAKLWLLRPNVRASDACIFLEFYPEAGRRPALQLVYPNFLKLSHIRPTLARYLIFLILTQHFSRSIVIRPKTLLGLDEYETYHSLFGFLGPRQVQSPDWASPDALNGQKRPLLVR